MRGSRNETTGRMLTRSASSHRRRRTHKYLRLPTARPANVAPVLDVISATASLWHDGIFPVVLMFSRHAKRADNRVTCSHVWLELADGIAVS